MGGPQIYKTIDMADKTFPSSTLFHYPILLTLAVVDGIVKAVYVPKEWKLTDDAAHEGRCEFVGKEDVQSEYLGKSVAETYGRSQNPVKYINM